MQSDDFSTEEILSWGNTSGHSEVLPSTSLDHAVNTPFAGAVETVFSDLEPFEAIRLGGSGVIDLSPKNSRVSTCLIQVTPTATKSGKLTYKRS